MPADTLIYELPFSRFHLAAALFSSVDYDQPAYDALFEGRQPGRIFVDDPDHPTAAMMCRTYEYFVAGDFSPSLHQFIVDSPADLDIFEKHYGYVVFHPDWEAALLRDLILGVIVRRNFHWQEGTPVPKVQLPDGARLVRVDDRAMLDQIDAALPAPFLELFWGDRGALHSGGFTWCVYQGDQLATVVYPVAVSDRGVILGIDTIEAYQRKGYGMAVSTAFLREAIERGLQPIWDCDGENIRSAALAKKLGFTERAPFHELYYADRKPQFGRGAWSLRETRDDGVSVWQKVNT